MKKIASLALIVLLSVQMLHGQNVVGQPAVESSRVVPLVLWVWHKKLAVGVGAGLICGSVVLFDYLFGNSLDKIERKVVRKPIKRSFLSVLQQPVKVYQWRLVDDYHDGFCWYTAADVKEASKVVSKVLLSDVYLPERVKMPRVQWSDAETHHRGYAIKIGPLVCDDMSRFYAMEDEIDAEFRELQRDLEFCKSKVTCLQLRLAIFEQVQNLWKKQIEQVIDLDWCSMEELAQLRDAVGAVMIEKKATTEELRALNLFFELIHLYTRLYHIRNACFWPQGLDSFK